MILVTGATGTVGRDVVAQLVEQVVGRQALTWIQWTRDSAGAFA